jgi:ketosteroid isomerase-like protein
MPEESTTPDLGEIMRQSVEANNRGDIDTVMSVYAPDAVWDNSAAGVGTFEGLAAIRDFMEDWRSAYEEFEIVIEEFRDLGSGVTFSVLAQRGRLFGSSGEVEVRGGTVGIWHEGLVKRVINYLDIDEARAAAERLAQERADG